MTPGAVADAVRAAQLEIVGGFHPGPEDIVPEGVGTLLLLGPREPGFWEAVSAAPEFGDGGRDPLDRWSAQVIGRLAGDLGALPFFPFGEPRRPFVRWALRTGRIWVSEVNLLITVEAGLLVSFRGALGFRERIAVPPPAQRPCDDCIGTPCLTACPVGALTASGYDVPACRSYVASPPGAASCGEHGCAVRLACPWSAAHPRALALHAHHMRYFA
jgi:epoxyqueuosine reductase